MQVLIVEDHQDSREQLERYLTRRGYDVATAGDLRTGIDSLDKRRFDAIISDFALPDGRATRSSVKLGDEGFAHWASPFQATRIPPMSASRERPDSIIT